jgi:hypothetical protein
MGAQNESGETIPQTIEELQAALQEKDTKIRTLEATRVGLLGDLTKKKTVDSFLKAAGIDVKDPEFEDKVVAAITGLRTAGTGTTDGANPPPEPPEGGKPPAAGGTPSDAVDSVLKAQLAALQSQVTRLEKEKETEKKEKEKEKKMRRDQVLKAKVVQELEGVDCRRPTHLHQLTKDNWRLLDDEETVVFGPEDDPVTLKDAAIKLREDPEYAIYFNGSGASGSGLPTSRSSIPITNNPFAVGSANATEAARLMQDDPTRGKRLMQDARLAGKLDSIIGSAFSGNA